jgi:hypothetical protein
MTRKTIHTRVTCLGLLVMLFMLVSCSTPQLQTRYNPLHPNNNQAVNFRAIASDSDGIASAELFVYEYELYVGANGFQSARQRAGGTWGSVHTWNFHGHPTAIDETHNFAAGFPASSYVTYIVRVRDTLGSQASESWTFAAGNWPFGNSPIPLWGNGAPANRIDIAFVADRGDYANAHDMMTDLDRLIFDGYHSNNGIKLGKKYWQFYYSPERGSISDFDTPPRVMDVPASIATSGIIDSAAVIHTTVKRDWASGGNFGTEPGNRGTAVHESGHAIFGLSDEYAGGGHSTSTNPHHNNYNSRAAAETYNSANSWPTTDVQNIEGSWWRPEPNTLNCIMLDDGDAAMPDFTRTCLNRVLWYYRQLEP